jgi:glycosyltransferase involved in cell wall biosynthesis
VLLEALARIADPCVKAVIVGDGDLRPQFKARAAALDLAGRAIFAGRAAQAELPAYYALCDALVLPSITMGEAFGIVLLEAMACAKPVIASDLPSVRTVAAHAACRPPYRAPQSNSRPRRSAARLGADCPPADGGRLHDPAGLLLSWADEHRLRRCERRHAAL